MLAEMMRWRTLIPRLENGLRRLRGGTRPLSTLLAYQKNCVELNRGDGLPQLCIKVFKNQRTFIASTSSETLMLSNSLINKDRVILFGLGRSVQP